MEWLEECLALAGSLCRCLGWTIAVLALAWLGLYHATTGSALDHPWAPDPRAMR